MTAGVRPILSGASGVSRDWNFVSGRAASLERSFLTPPFFPDLLGARNAEEAFALLSENAPEIFPHLKSIADYDRVLSERFAGLVGSLAADSPPDGPAEIFFRQIDLARVHEYLTGPEAPRKNGEEVKRSADRLAGAYGWIDPLDLSAERSDLFRARPLRSLSLWVDSSFLRSLLLRAGRSPALLPYIKTLAALQAVATCLRSVPASISPAELESFFFRPALLQAGLPRPSDPAAPLSRLLGEYGIVGLRASEDGLSEDFSRAADDHLTAVAAAGRFEPFGPLPILYFFRRLQMETLNLRLCLAAILAPIEREVAEKRLRRL
jgi:hypothetical protein